MSVDILVFCPGYHRLVCVIIIFIFSRIFLSWYVKIPCKQEVNAALLSAEKDTGGSRFCIKKSYIMSPFWGFFCTLEFSDERFLSKYV